MLNCCTTPRDPRVKSLYVLSPFLIFPTHFFSLPLYSPNEWEHTMFVLLRLTYFTQHNTLQFLKGQTMAHLVVFSRHLTPCLVHNGVSKNDCCIGQLRVASWGTFNFLNYAIPFCWDVDFFFNSDHTISITSNITQILLNTWIMVEESPASKGEVIAWVVKSKGKT